MNRTPSDIENRLRLSLAAPAMLTAVQSAVELVRQRYHELHIVAVVNMGDEDAEKVANEWLRALWLLEEAVRQAQPAMQPKTHGVVEITRRAK